MSRVAKSAETRAFDEAVGRRIADARKRHRLKCKELAAAARISAGALYWYESGRTSCPPMVLSRIAETLQVSIAALVP